MLKTYLYVPEKLNKEIVSLAKSKKLSKAELIRTALKEGVHIIKGRSTGTAGALIEIKKVAEKYKAKGPADLSSNIDKYLWGI